MQLTQPPHDADAEPRIAFDVIDVLGLCTLEKRSPTLDGSVPLRVARACMPLLEGNAFGFQIALRKRIELRKRFGAFQMSSFEDEPACAREHRATLPMLIARGLLARGGVWHERLERGIVDAGHLARRSTGSPIAFWTGLLVRPRAGVRLRQSSTANRRSVTFTVDEVILDDTDAYCPLVLGIAPADDTDTVVLHGEIATLAALPARARLSHAALDEAPEVARAHLAFYDARYFATKREHPSRKYKHLATRAPSPAEGAADLHVRAACAGPATVFEACPRQIAGAKGPRPEPYAPDRFVFRNALDFSARFDGQHVGIDFDKARLAAHAESIRAAWAGLLGTGDEGAQGAHRGALWYLTKYFTPHPPGEPHFFVKPWSLMHTPAGCSMLLEGIPGPGYDVLRGVVRTDVFHATPAVFALRQPGLRVGIGEGTPLLSLFPVPRALQHATFHMKGFRDAFA